MGKTYKNLPDGTYTVSLDFIKIDSWDNENAYVQVNGKTCWQKKLAGSGKQVCGSKNGGWNEDRIKVSCTAPAVNNQFTVRVYTQLNSAANDESFAIDNVVVKKYVFKTITANFQDTKDFEGFNCVKITTCGAYGNICGGYNTKAQSHDIKKTYTLPDGLYQVSLDFIKIDSWDGESANVQLNGKTCWSKKLAGSGKQVCGGKHGGWNEDKFKVTCTAPALNNKLTVRVFTTLNQAANDESFGIDNVVLKKVQFKTTTANFNNAKDFQGWNCAKVQNCGSLGNVCGGYNAKGQGHGIKKTFAVPPGK